MTIKPRGHHNKVSKYFFTLCHGDWKKKNTLTTMQERNKQERVP